MHVCVCLFNFLLITAYLERSVSACHGDDARLLGEQIVGAVHTGSQQLKRPAVSELLEHVLNVCARVKQKEGRRDITTE